MAKAASAAQLLTFRTLWRLRHNTGFVSPRSHGPFCRGDWPLFIGKPAKGASTVGAGTGPWASTVGAADIYPLDMYQ